jgi:hypothetical protein
VFVEELFEHQTLSSRMVFDQQNGVVRTPKKGLITIFFLFFYIEFNVKPFKNPDQPLQFISFS